MENILLLNSVLTYINLLHKPVTAVQQAVSLTYYYDLRIHQYVNSPSPLCLSIPCLPHLTLWQDWLFHQAQLKQFVR